MERPPTDGNASASCTPALRKFALALRRVVEDVPGPENLQGEKIMKALKIGRSRYYELRLEVEKNLV